MTLHDIITFLASFLGGGFVAAVLNWIHANRTARREREIAWLQEQLRSLYGPLSFFTSQNEHLLRLGGNAQDAYQAFFSGRWSEDERTQSALLEQGEATTSLGNLYMKRVTKNNARTMTILDTNWRLADSADRDVLSRFQVDHTRFLVEVKEHARDRIPLTIINKLGPITYMHPDMISSVRAVVQRKQARLAELRSS